MKTYSFEIQQVFNEKTVWEQLHGLKVHEAPWEQQLFHIKVVRRLEHLHHYGAGALISLIRSA